jgi:hypothetical protein
VLQAKLSRLSVLADSGIFLPLQAMIALLSRFIRHLVHELRQPVDGEARPVLRLALQADLVRPLVAREKF